MGIVFYYAWEIALIDWLQESFGQIGTHVFSFFTLFGEQFVVALVVLFLYLCYDKQLGEDIILNLMTALCWGSMVKNIVCRRRPYFDHPQIECQKPVEADADIYNIVAQGYSFPSLHSITASVAYCSIAAFLKKRWIWILALVFSLAVGVSRFALGVHHPTDVLAGYAVGAAAILFVKMTGKLTERKWIHYAIVVLACLPGLFFADTDDYYACFGILAGCCAGFLFEKRFVNFTQTRAPLQMILRIAAGMCVFFAFSTAPRLFFSPEMLESGKGGGFIIRTVRYLIASFATTGPFPYLFRFFERAVPSEEDR